MKEIPYKTFSLKTHKKNLKLNRPNVCQFELTFRCDFHCGHCYTDCYNERARFKGELNTEEVKLILDKLCKAGIIWLCFTGGDPLTRRDFPNIYSYAKDKGFIIIIFTNGYSVTEEIVETFKEKPPFVIEVTLNAVTEKLYEKISQVKGSFNKVMEGIELILKEKLPLKIKTQITKDNLRELPEIKNFVERRGLKFRPDSDLYPRLNGDLAPCDFRITPQEILKLDGRVKTGCPGESDDLLFHCAVGGGDGINLDPYGNMFLCRLIRKPAFNLLKIDFEYTSNKLLSLVRNIKFVNNSKCNGCSLREFCRWCPGRAYLETGDEEVPVEYYCELTKKTNGLIS